MGTLISLPLRQESGQCDKGCLVHLRCLWVNRVARGPHEGIVTVGMDAMARLTYIGRIYRLIPHNRSSGRSCGVYHSKDLVMLEWFADDEGCFQLYYPQPGCELFMSAYLI